MKIRDLLGMNNKKNKTEKKSDEKETSSSSLERNKIPASGQDSCCGSCGGNGHADRKGRQG